MSEQPDTTDRSDSSDSSDSSDLGPMPDPVVEPGEPAPGGPDALHDAGDGDVVPADLPPEANPAVDTTSTPAVADIAEGEDTSTEATREADPDAGADVDKENPA